MSKVKSLTLSAVFAAGFLACAKGFYALGAMQLDYALPYGTGMDAVPLEEISFYAWFALFGTMAAACLTVSLACTGIPDALNRTAKQLAGGPKLTALTAGGLTCLASLAIHLYLLREAYLTPDCYSYVFGAQTLAKGHLVNVAPSFVAEFHNPLIVINEQGWWSKYPLGHTALLALGEVIGARFLVAPLVLGASVCLVWGIAERLSGRSAALVASLLLVCSPQFVLTGTTFLSQPTSALCALLTLYALLRTRETGAVKWAILAGCALGYGVFTRPMPHLLFIPTVTALWLISPRLPMKRRLALLMLAVPFVALGGLALALQQFAQTGSLFTTTYKAAHGTTGFALGADDVGSAVSFGSALLRLNFWALGWPFALAFAVFAHRQTWRVALAFLIPSIAYRFLAPKVGMSPTGPLYVFEMVPFIALLTGCGAARVPALARSLPLRAPRCVRTAALCALTVTGLCLFLPVQLLNLRTAAGAWHEPFEHVRSAGAESALVFANRLTDVGRNRTWAFSPPNPSPDLDDPVIFVRDPRGEDAAQRVMTLWKNHFPDRRAFILRFTGPATGFWEVKTEADFFAPEWQRDKMKKPPGSQGPSKSVGEEL